MTAEARRTIPRERALTEWLARLFPRDAARVPIGIGDDAAVVLSRSRTLVLKCDPVVEGVHFEADTPRSSVGRKVVMRNASDLAAMGASPDFLLVSVVFRRGTRSADERRLFRGLRDAARQIGAQVVGGDVAVSAGPLVVTVTMVGHLEGPALRRDRARIGDTVHVTGPLGGSILGRHLRIRPRLVEGRWLASQDAVRAGMDVSDGLAVDLWTLLRASGVPGAELDEAAIPLHRDARRLAAARGSSAIDHALGDGEDHELLFTLRRGGRLGRGGPLTALARRPIGRLVARRGLWLRRRDGTLHPLSPRGWQHRT
ncbi:MAG: thiamine-phosphate kinase [Planctomycetota bacterium]